MVVGAASDTATGPEAGTGKGGSEGGQAGEETAARNASTGSGGGEAEGGGEEVKEEVNGEREETPAKDDGAAATADGGRGDDKGKQADGTPDLGGSVSPQGGGVDGDGPGQQEDQEQEQAVTVEGREGDHGEEEEEQEEEAEEKWYLMAGTWLSRWHAYVLSGAGEDLDFPTPPPGPITNGDLVDENSVPIPGKIAGKHYR